MPRPCKFLSFYLFSFMKQNFRLLHDFSLFFFYLLRKCCIYIWYLQHSRFHHLPGSSYHLLVFIQFLILMIHKKRNSCTTYKKNNNAQKQTPKRIGKMKVRNHTAIKSYLCKTSSRGGLSDFFLFSCICL